MWLQGQVQVVDVEGRAVVPEQWEEAHKQARIWISRLAWMDLVCVFQG